MAAVAKTRALAPVTLAMGLSRLPGVLGLGTGSWSSPYTTAVRTL